MASTDQSHPDTKEGLSLTATFIMIKLWGLLQSPAIRSIYPEELYHYTDHLISVLPKPLSKFHSLLQNPLLRKLLASINEIGLRGDLGHIIARKKITLDWLDHKKKSHPADTLQVIFMGGGLDFAPLYMSRAQYETFSLEMPSTANIHRRVLGERFHMKNHHIISSPVGAPLYHTLINHPNFDTTKSTILIAEGIWDYIPEHRVPELLQQIKRLASSVSSLELWSTLFVLDELPWYYQWSYRSSVRSVGEQLRFNYTSDSFLALLQQYGASLLKIRKYDEIERELASLIDHHYPVLNGFYMGQWQF